MRRCIGGTWLQLKWCALRRRSECSRSITSQGAAPPLGHATRPAVPPSAWPPSPLALLAIAPTPPRPST
eukprot:5115391-Prymnesium_polylepis.1